MIVFEFLKNAEKRNFVASLSAKIVLACAIQEVARPLQVRESQGKITKHINEVF